MKPILFNIEMVRAILDGRKTQTRRVVKTGSYTPLEIGRSKFYTFRDELNGKPGAWAGFYCERDVFTGTDGKQHIDAVYAKAPYIPGDIMYVRETWANLNTEENPCFFYKATDEMPEWSLDKRWRPSIHMPKEAARIFLRVTDVRVERLWNIQPTDICAEGVCVGANDSAEAAYKSFTELWDSTIQPADRDRYGWAANPWVWVISFERYDPADPEGGADNG